MKYKYEERERSRNISKTKLTRRLNSKSRKIFEETNDNMSLLGDMAFINSNCIMSKCPFCSPGSSGIHRDHLVSKPKSGEIVCCGCGSVKAARVIDEGCEWRASSEDNSHLKSVRVAPGDDALGGLGSVLEISLSGSDRKPRKLVRDPLESKILRGLHLVKDLGSFANLSQGTQKMAQEIFSEAVMKELDYSRNDRLLAGASLFLACKLQGFPRTLDEISSAINEDKSALGRLQDLIAKELSLPITLTHPKDLISRFLFQSGALNPVILHECEHVCDQLNSLSTFDGSIPQVVAAAVILLVCLVNEQSIHVDRLLEVASCQVAAINRQYICLRSYLSVILPEATAKRKAEVCSTLPNLIDKSLLKRIQETADAKGTNEAVAEAKKQRADCEYIPLKPVRNSSENLSRNNSNSNLAGSVEREKRKLTPSPSSKSSSDSSEYRNLFMDPVGGSRKRPLVDNSRLLTPSQGTPPSIPNLHHENSIEVKEGDDNAVATEGK